MKSTENPSRNAMTANLRRLVKKNYGDTINTLVESQYSTVVLYCDSNESQYSTVVLTVVRVMIAKYRK